MQLRGLGHLQYLDLARNNFSGTIPHSLLRMYGVYYTTETAFQYLQDSPYGDPEEVSDSLGPNSYVSISAVTKGQA